MPEFSVRLRYRREWIAYKIVEALNAQEAQEEALIQFAQVRDYMSFEQFVEENSTPQFAKDTLEVDEVEKV